MGGRRMRVGIGVSMALLVTWLLWSDDQPGQGAGGEVLHRGPSDAESIEVVVERSLAVLERAAANGESLAAQDGSRKADATGCTWPANHRQHRFDLAERLLLGHWKADWMWRHRLLNRLDRAPCPEDVRELDRLVRILAEAIDPVVEAHDAMSSEATIRAIEAGQVPEWTSPRVTGRALDQMALQLHERRVAAGLASSLAAAREELWANPPHQHPTSSYVFHRGSYYLRSEFPHVPGLQKSHDAVRFCIVQAAHILIGWFVSNGYTTYDAELEDVLQRISAPGLSPNPAGGAGRRPG